MFRVRWTKQDHLVAQNWQSAQEVAPALQGGVPGDFWGVTPYFLNPASYWGLAEARSLEPGTLIDIDQNQAYSPRFLPRPFWLARFLPGRNSILKPSYSDGRGWLDIPGPLLAKIDSGDIVTIEDLCRELNSHSSLRFPGNIYGPSVLNNKGTGSWTTAPANNIARLLFDWDENNEWRYTLTDLSGQFSYGTYYSSPWELPVKSGDTLIQKVLGIQGITISARRCTGGSGTCTDPLRERIRRHLKTMDSLMIKLYQLKQAYKEELNERQKYIGSYKVITTILDACKDHSLAGWDVKDLWGKSVEVLDRIQHRLAEIPVGGLPKKPFSSQDPAAASIVDALNKAMEPSENLEAAIDLTISRLLYKITTDQEFAADLKEWKLFMLETGNSDPDNISLCEEVYTTFKNAIEAIEDAGGEETSTLAVMAKTAVENLSAEALDQSSLIERINGANGAMEILSATIKTTGRSYMSLFGNTNSPPSFAVAMVKLAVWDMVNTSDYFNFGQFGWLRPGLTPMAHNPATLSKYSKITTWLFTHLEPLIPEDSKNFYLAFRDAVKARNWSETDRLSSLMRGGNYMHPEYGLIHFPQGDPDAMGVESTQTSMKWIGPLYCLQIISTLWLYYEYRDACADAEKDDKWEKVAKAWATGASLGVSLGQTAMMSAGISARMWKTCRFLDQIATSKGFYNVNRFMGGAGSLISAVIYLCDAYTAWNNGEYWDASVYAAGAAANLFLGIVLIGGWTGLPLIIAIGAVVAVSLLGLTTTDFDLSSPTVVKGILRRLKTSTITHLPYAFLTDDSNVGPLLREFGNMLDEIENIPLVPNKAYAVFNLEKIGLPESMIKSLTGSDGLPPDLTFYRNTIGNELVTI